MNRFLRAALLLACFTSPGVSETSSGLSGAYLAARQAGFHSDYVEAADWLERALARDQGNPMLMESALTALIGLGDFDRALPIAARMQDEGFDSQLANMVRIAGYGRDGDFEAILAGYEAGADIGPLIDGLVTAWALVGTGDMTRALAGFDAVADQLGSRDFGLYHKALALALVGDYEGADHILSGAAQGPLRATLNGVFTHAEVLSHLGRNDDALDLLQRIFGTATDPSIANMRERLTAGDVLPMGVASSAQDGLAEVFYSVAGVLENEASPAYTLIYARMAAALNETKAPALLMAASLLEELEQYDLATRAYDLVPRGHPSFHEAEIGRAGTLRLAGNNAAAIEVLTQLSEARFDLPVVHTALGDALRAMERYDEAAEAYTRAIALFGELEARHWIAFYSRGIAHERRGEWALSEADFRQALALSPGQPYVLNYLGYSLVEQRRKLDEALTMIEEAVAGRPDDGYVTDSLGWVLYRLGRYSDAVVHMERAAELMPVDPVVTDHLGDVLWAVGRRREAEFQWKRALSFVDLENADDEADPDRIRRKLEVGLDVVLDEEGSEPLAVAGVDGNGG